MNSPSCCSRRFLSDRCGLAESVSVGDAHKLLQVKTVRHNFFAFRLRDHRAIKKFLTTAAMDSFALRILLLFRGTTDGLAMSAERMFLPSVGLAAAGGRNDAVHTQILNHLSVVIVGMGDGEFRTMQPGILGALRDLQHVAGGDRGRGFVA